MTEKPRSIDVRQLLLPATNRAPRPLPDPWLSARRYRHLAKRRINIAKPGIDCLAEVRDIVFGLNLERQMKGRLSVEIDAYPPDHRRRDLDNILKAALDAIQHSGLIDDDNQFDDIRIRRCLVQPASGFCRLTIVEVSDLEAARLDVPGAKAALAAADRRPSRLAV